MMLSTRLDWSGETRLMQGELDATTTPLKVLGNVCLTHWSSTSPPIERYATRFCDPNRLNHDGVRDENILKLVEVIKPRFLRTA